MSAAKDNRLSSLVGLMGLIEVDGEEKACRVTHVHKDGKICNVRIMRGLKPSTVTVLCEQVALDEPNVQGDSLPPRKETDG